MVGKLSIALLIAASPVLAEEPASNEADAASEAQATPVAYKTKRVCRSIEVVGSSIPRTTCTTKRIPIKPVAPEVNTDSEQAGQSEAPHAQ
jgi:hypothetical protein